MAKALDKPRNILYSWSSAHGSSPVLARSKLAAESTDELQVKKVGGLGLQTRFEEDAQISSQDPLVVVRADQLTGEAKVVLDYLEHFKAGPSGVLPIKSDDKLVMLKTEDGLKAIDLLGFVGVSPQIRPKFKRSGIFLLFAQSFYPRELPSGASRPLGLYLGFHDLIALIWSQCQSL